MKKSLHLLNAILFAFYTTQAIAQIADGATAPDFTFTDMNGNTQNLYTYLNQGKFVSLDVSAIWCSPCWDYHNNAQTGELLYNAHGTPGDNTWQVLWVEADNTTNDPCMTNSAGCTGGPSQGNWVSGTAYPMMNPPAGAAYNSFNSGYNIQFFPTLFLICPNKKIYGSTLNGLANWPTVADWENEASAKCGATGIDNFADKNPLTVYPNPATDHVGLYFNLNNSNHVMLKIVNPIGQTVSEKDFGVLPAGDQSLNYKIRDMMPGIYSFIILSDGNRSVSKTVLIQ